MVLQLWRLGGTALIVIRKKKYSTIIIRRCFAEIAKHRDTGRYKILSQLRRNNQMRLTRSKHCLKNVSSWSLALLAEYMKRHCCSLQNMEAAAMFDNKYCVAVTINEMEIHY